MTKTSLIICLVPNSCKIIVSSFQDQFLRQENVTQPIVISRAKIRGKKSEENNQPRDSIRSNWTGTKLSSRPFVDFSHQVCRIQRRIEDFSILTRLWIHLDSQSYEEDDDSSSWRPMLYQPASLPGRFSFRFKNHSHDANQQMSGEFSSVFFHDSCGNLSRGGKTKFNNDWRVIEREWSEDKKVNKISY